MTTEQRSQYAAGLSDQSQRVWGGTKDVNEMGKSLERWLHQKAKAKWIERETMEVASY